MILLWILALITIFFSVIFIKDIIVRFSDDKTSPLGMFICAIIGLVTDFFDTLGIGSFAPTTALLKFTKQGDEQKLPGTLNVSHTIPVVIEAFIFITVVEVEAITLISLITASVVGAYFGAGVISKLNKKMVKIIMGSALIVVAVIMIFGEMGLISKLGDGNEAIALTGAPLAISVVIFLILGALMSAGVGLYAPAMATVYFMGLSPAVAFPIMMGSCAFLMPVGSTKFIKEQAYSLKASLFITLGGIVGVFLAAFLFTSLDIALLTKLVIVVVIITGSVMLYEALFKDE